LGRTLTSSALRRSVVEIRLLDQSQAHTWKHRREHRRLLHATDQQFLRLDRTSRRQQGRCRALLLPLLFRLPAGHEARTCADVRGRRQPDEVSYRQLGRVSQVASRASQDGDLMGVGLGWW
jgi:hypothetical protein